MQAMRKAHILQAMRKAHILMDTKLKSLLDKTLDRGLYQIIISNPRKRGEVSKIKIRPILIKGEYMLQETTYQGKKVFHKNYEAQEIITKIENYLSTDFKQCEIEHTNMRAVIFSNRKGELSIKTKSMEIPDFPKISLSHNRVKNHILKEGNVIPFLIDLGVQTSEGKIIRARYDKYKQINRFLEFIEDIVPALPKDRTVRIVDFGCGKSYLTFAIYYYLHELKGMDVEITGLDLKEDVIEHCNELSQKYGYDKLNFIRGDIAEYEGLMEADMVVTLHACDTATDYALAKAVRWKAKVILSVPCCQHEINKQINAPALDSVL